MHSFCSIFIYTAKKESVHSSLALPYSKCIEAAYFKFCTDIPCSMDKNIINFVYSRNFILKKKFHLFVAHHCNFGNHFSVAGMPFSCDNHIMSYPSHCLNQTLSIGMWIVYHSPCKVWASCRWLTGAFVSSGDGVQAHDSPSL